MSTGIDLGLIVSGVLATAAVYWLTVAFYSAIPVFFPSHAARYKIQARGSGLSRAQHVRLIALTIFNQVPLTLVVVIGSAIGYTALGGELQIGFPAWPVLLGHGLGWLLIFEIGFYASHRLLHTHWFYRRVHILHHRFKAPVPYAAACVHPLEFLLSYIVPTFGGALLLNFSFAEILLFVSAEYIHTVHDHSGHFYWWDPFYWICSQNAWMHDEHHRRPTVNFGGAFTGLPDRLFGTYAIRELKVVEPSRKA